MILNQRYIYYLKIVIIILQSGSYSGDSWTFKLNGPVGRKAKQKSVSFAPLVERSASHDDLCGYVGLKPAPKASSSSKSALKKRSKSNDSRTDPNRMISTKPKPSFPPNMNMVPRYFHDEPQSVAKPLRRRRIFDEPNSESSGGLLVCQDEWAENERIDNMLASKVIIYH